jgi:outer membrane protein
MKKHRKGLAICLIVAASSAAQAATQPASPAAVPAVMLTLSQAEQMAINNNPRISVARLLALAQAQVTREVRSAEMPIATGHITGVDANDGSRISAGALNNPTLYTRAGAGLTVRQLITDFGRTHHLVLSAKASADAQLENQRATQQDIILTVDQAFYQALTAQAVLKVAQETVSERQNTADQISALTASKLRSDLDLRFADVELSQAKLLLLDAQGDSQKAMANLNTVLGSDSDQPYTQVDDTHTTPEPAPQDAEPLVHSAFSARPDLAALTDSYTAAQQYSSAEHDLWLPTISALAAVGGTPIRTDQFTSSWYGAAGANIDIPIFNGFRFNARSHEAALRANAAQEQVRDLRNVIARDVRNAVINAQNAFQHIGVTQEMLKESNMALDLAQARYQIGLSGIVELSQAQLSQTQAKIAYVTARYSYQTALAVLRYQLGQ